MPTGYTSKLYDGDQDFNEFVLTCARNFGALVTMRDHALDAPIPDAFEVSPYHVEQLGKAMATISEVQALSDEECQRRADDAHARWTEDRAAAKSENDARAARYVAMLDRVKAWVPPTPDHEGLREFMVQQLEESVKFDVSNWTPPEPTRRGETWRAEAIVRARRDVEHHADELDKERERVASRNAWVRALRESLDGPVLTPVR